MNKPLACLLVFTTLTGAPALAQQASTQQASTQQALAQQALAQPAQAAQLQPLDRIAAVVDEDVILRSELERAVGNVSAQYAGREHQLPPRDVLERQVLERLVMTRLQVARAQSTGVRVSDQELDAAIANIARQNRLSPEQLRQQLAGEGQTYAEFRNSVREELTVQRLRQRFAQSRIAVSDAEVDAALAAQAGAGLQYRLAHILIAVPDGATPEQIATAQQKVDGVKALVDRGEMDFASAAVRYSDSQNALEGGDLGWRSLDEIPSGFATTIRGLGVGEIFGPVRGPSGFQLLKLVETRDATQAAGGSVTEYQARHILVRVNEIANDAQAKARIETIAARVAGGADFAALAKDSSEDASTRSQGGDLGWFAEDAYGADFGAQVAALGDGGVSAPFRSEAGWHLVQRVSSRQTDVGDQNRRAQLRETIGRRKLEDEYNRFLQEMRGEAFVEIRKPDATTEPPASGG
jgi:peptidyl-prolyl cis-trans isomerase SurA